MEGSAKIRIKVGAMELDYEGDPSFLKDGLIDLLHKMSGFVDAAVEEEDADAEVAATEGVPMNGAKVNGASMSTTTIAARLGAKSCSDLVLAALSKIQISDGESAATRKEIAAAMKSAPGYFKQGMQGGNLTKAFTTLVKSGRLNQLGDDRYSLTASEKQKIEAKIAEH